MELRAARNERDERGRRIPVAGTIARTIYDLYAAGVSTKEIAARVQRRHNYVLVVLWKCENADLANAYHKLAPIEARAS